MSTAIDKHMKEIKKNLGENKESQNSQSTSLIDQLNSRIDLNKKNSSDPNNKKKCY